MTFTQLELRAIFQWEHLAHRNTEQYPSARRANSKTSIQMWCDHELPSKWHNWLEICIQHWMNTSFDYWIKMVFTHWPSSFKQTIPSWGNWSTLLVNHGQIFIARWHPALTWHSNSFHSNRFAWDIVNQKWFSGSLRRNADRRTDVSQEINNKSSSAFADKHKTVNCCERPGHSNWDHLNLALIFVFRLDELLSDGLMMGNLIDICGSPDAGKTQLCTSIAINLAQFSQVETLWIDTKADFSARRIQKILKNRNCRETEIREIMQRIRIDTCNDPHKLIQMIEQLIENFEAYQSARLLVIDSLPALWFLFHGEDRHVGSTAIAKLANNLRKLAVECGMVILTVNIATRYSPIDSGERSFGMKMLGNV